MKTLAFLAKGVALWLLLIGVGRLFNLLPRPTNISPLDISAWAIWWQSSDLFAGVILIAVAGISYFLSTLFLSLKQPNSSPRSCTEQ